MKKENIGTLNQLLSEMDGFRTCSNQVLVIGDTNRKDVLDKVLTRSGRVVRSISISLPDEESRRSFFKKHVVTKQYDSIQSHGDFVKEESMISILPGRTKLRSRLFDNSDMERFVVMTMIV